MAKTRPAAPTSSVLPAIVTPAPTDLALSVPMEVLKGQAKRLHKALANNNAEFTLSEAQHLLAQTWGERDWHHLLERRALRPQRGPGPGNLRTEPRQWALSDMTSQMIASLILRLVEPNDITWTKQRSETVLPVLVENLRRVRKGHLLPQDLLECLALPSIVDLFNRTTLPAAEHDALKIYLENIGWDPDLDENDSNDKLTIRATKEYHEYITSIVRKALHALSGMMPFLNVVIWRQTWTEPLGNPELREAVLYSWLDRYEPQNLLQGTVLFRSPQYPVVQVKHLLERLAQTLSDREAATLLHWLHRTTHPEFLDTSLKLEQLLATKSDTTNV